MRKKQRVKIITNNMDSGITLIALVVTIIVMLVIAGISMTMAINGGLFDYAGKAVADTNNEKTKEQMLAAGAVFVDGFWYDSYQDYLNGVYSENQPNAEIKMTYWLNSTDLTKGEVQFYVSAELKDYLSYDTYATQIIEQLEKQTNNANDLKLAKEELLLEGINYFDYNGEWGRKNGEGFANLQEFVDYINENSEKEQYSDIYDLMQNWAGLKDGETEDTIITVFLIKNGDYVHPEYYYEYEENHNKMNIKKPDGTTEEIWSGGSITYQVNKNGNYTFIATNNNGEKGAITVNINNRVEEKFSSIYSQTTLYEDVNGDIAYIPKGFAVGVEATNATINTVADGLVITDAVDGEGNSIGNEFVWIPVNYTKQNKDENENGLDDGFEEVFYRSAWSDNNRTTGLDTRYKEDQAHDMTEKYDYMMKSVENYHGFYMGRYEAGSDTPRYDTANGTTKMSIKRGKYPYNYVGFSKDKTTYTEDVVYNSKNQGKSAILLSLELYQQSNKDIVSTLAYGIQWDAMLDFIKDQVDVTSTEDWGNQLQSQFMFNGKYTTDYTTSNWNTSLIDIQKRKNNLWKITTGASEQCKAKNLYDVAGNCIEWTMEMFDDGANKSPLLRGDHTGYDCGSRGTSSFDWCQRASFRVSLYILEKNAR